MRGARFWGRGLSGFGFFGEFAFWLKVFNDLKTRGCADILIAVTDGLTGMGDALAVDAFADGPWGRRFPIIATL